MSHTYIPTYIHISQHTNIDGDKLTQNEMPGIS